MSEVDKRDLTLAMFFRNGERATIHDATIKLTLKQDYPNGELNEIDLITNIRLFLADEILIKSGDKSTYVPTQKAEDIFKGSGFKKYEIITNENLEKQRRKLNQDIKMSEFFIKTKWWPIIISVIAIILSIISLFWRYCKR
jgi:hypothetical protein